MTPWDSLLALAAATAAAFVIDSIVRSRVATRDSGPFWAHVCRRFGLCVAAGLLLAPGLLPLEGVQQYLPTGSRGWLMTVFFVWAAILGIGMLAPAAEARWIAGACGFSPRRFWILGFAAVLIPAVAFGFGGWTDPQDAAAWAYCLLLATGLVALALSSAAPVRTASAPQQKQDAETAEQLLPWPDALRAAHVGVDTLHVLPAGTSKGDGRGEATLQWSARAAAGLRNVAPGLLSAVRRVTDTAPEDGGGRVGLVFAPAHNGQIEAVVAAAADLCYRVGEVTLLVVPGEADTIAARLRAAAAAAGAGIAVETVSAEERRFEKADLWVVDAEILSDFLLAWFRDDMNRQNGSQQPLLDRIGLVVWWNLHRYTGVRAGNLWAISRRLERLLQAHGRRNVRALAFGRPAHQGVAQTTGFVEHLLPYPFTADDEFRIDAVPRRPVHVHRIDGPLAVAASASVAAGWPTAIGGVPESVVKAMVGTEHVGGKRLTDTLAPSPEEASARLVLLEAEDVLALPALVMEGCRNGPSDTPLHVGLLPAPNPYIHYLLDEFREAGQVPWSRHLLAAEGHPRLIQRHVHQALREMSDTLTGLRGTFMWEEGMLADTLRDLSGRGQLSRHSVRFLDDERRLQRDYLYASLQPDTGSSRPLDTVGLDLIEVRDPAIRGAEGLHIRIDPERVAIDAYPRRVFLHRGRRFRIAEWTAATDMTRITCSPEELPVATWRGRNATVRSIRTRTREMVTGRVRRYAATAEYHDELTEVIERYPDGSLKKVGLIRPIRTRFETEVLVLETETTADDDTLHLVAMAMRHILPVHFGAGESHMDVLPLVNAVVEGRGRVSGFAIVDLLPGGGVGLIGAIRQENALIALLLERCRSWLGDAAAGGKTAQDLFANSPLAAGTGGVAGLDLRRALHFVERL